MADVRVGFQRVAVNVPTHREVRGQMVSDRSAAVGAIALEQSHERPPLKVRPLI